MDTMDVKELEKVVTVLGGRENESMSGCSVALRLFDVKHGKGVHLTKRREKREIEKGFSNMVV